MGGEVAMCVRLVSLALVHSTEDADTQLSELVQELPEYLYIKFHFISLVKTL